MKRTGNYPSPTDTASLGGTSLSGDHVSGREGIFLSGGGGGEHVGLHQRTGRPEHLLLGPGEDLPVPHGPAHHSGDLAGERNGGVTIKARINDG